MLLLAGCVVADGPPEEVLQPQLLVEAFGNRMIRTAEGAVVVDDHGHAEADDAEVDATDLLPQHDHDHVHHGAFGLSRLLDSHVDVDGAHGGDEEQHRQRGEDDGRSLVQETLGYDLQQGASRRSPRWQRR